MRDQVRAVPEVVFRLPGVFLRSKSLPTNKVLPFLPSVSAVEYLFYFPFFLVVNYYWVGSDWLVVFDRVGVIFLEE